MRFINRTMQAIKVMLLTVGMLLMPGGIGTVTDLAAAAALDPQGNKQGAKPPKENKGRGSEPGVVAIDLDGHRRVVREYVTAGSLPPGLAKRRELPPGLANQLREKGELPPGLRDYLTPVPASMSKRFPVIPGHYTRYFAGRDLIIVDTRQNVVVSHIRDILD